LVPAAGLPDGLDVARDRAGRDPGRDHARVGAVGAVAAPRVRDRRAARGGGVIENVVSVERYRPEGADAIVRLRHAYKVYRVGDVGGVALAGGDLGVRPRE